MGKHIESLIEELEDIKNEAKMKELETSRFTVTLNVRDMRKLEYFCDYFGVKRATFATELILGALAEIEEHLKLNLTVPRIMGEEPLNEMQKKYFEDILRIGACDHYDYRGGKLVVTDKDGNILKTDFTEEDEESEEEVNE